jgi:polysaccharide pyruvyl transferase WcaK-like protein
MKHPERARIYSSKDGHASRMTAVLRSLDLLVTSRYHAGVLSLAANVPQVALGHDPRLESFYGELGIRDDFFVRHPDPEAFRKVGEMVDRLMAEPGPVRELLKKGNAEHLARAWRNRRLLRDFMRGRGWKVVE